MSAFLSPYLSTRPFICIETFGYCSCKKTADLRLQHILVFISENIARQVLFLPEMFRFRSKAIKWTWRTIQLITGTSFAGRLARHARLSIVMTSYLPQWQLASSEWNKMKSTGFDWYGIAGSTILKAWSSTLRHKYRWTRPQYCLLSLHRREAFLVQEVMPTGSEAEMMFQLTMMSLYYPKQSQLARRIWRNKNQRKRLIKYRTCQPETAIVIHIVNCILQSTDVHSVLLSILLRQY